MKTQDGAAPSPRFVPEPTPRPRRGTGQAPSALRGARMEQASAPPTGGGAGTARPAGAGGIGVDMDLDFGFVPWLMQLISMCSVPMLLIGLALLCLGGRLVWRGVASTTWPRVEGVVAHSALTFSTRQDSDHTYHLHGADIVFQYQVGGRTYTTDTIYVSYMPSTKISEAILWHLRYPQGARVPVWHHSHAPARAVVRPGVYYDQAGWMLGVGLCLLLAAGVGRVTSAGNPPGRDGYYRGLCLLLLVLGLPALVGGGGHLWRTAASTTWPVTRGRVVANPLTTFPFTGEDSDGTPATDTVYGDQVVFTYEVAGQSYVARTPQRVGEVEGGTPGWRAAKAARYPLGAEVRVAYAPTQPERATLEPGLHAGAWILPGIGAALWLCALAFWGVRRLMGLPLRRRTSG